MRKLFTVLLTLLLCVCAHSAYAASTILQDGGSYNAGTGSSSKTFTISTPRPADQLTFQLSRQTASIGGIDVKAIYLDGTEETIISNKTDKNQSYSFNGKIVKELVFIKNGTLKRTISNVQLTQAVYLHAPGAATLDFGTAKSYAANGVQTTTLDWSDVEGVQVSLTGDDAAQFEVTTTGLPTTIGGYGTITIEAQYKHNVAGTHTATITVSNGTWSYDIALRGTTEKKDQSIVWAEKYNDAQIVLPIGTEVLDAATATSGLAVSYSSSNEAVLAITDGGAGFKAVAEGSAVLTATQAGDDNEWNSVSASKDITVTAKKVQNILWTDNLSRLKVGGEPVALTAVVRILSTDGENETYTEDPTRTALLTYTSGNEQVVTVDNATRMLTIVGEGETTLTATAPDDAEYEGATVSMPVRVRAASALCDAYVLDDAAERTLNTISSTTYAITGPAEQLTFTANRAALAGFSAGNLKADIYYDGNWHKVFDQSVPKDNWQTYSIDVPRNTTQVKFYTETGATGYKHIKDVSVTMARYIETTTPAIVVEQSIIGDKIQGTIQVQYSNLPDDLPITHNSNAITLSQESLENICGEYGEKVIAYTAIPTAVGTIEDIITIADEKTGLSIAIPVTIHTQRNTQSIVWDADLSHISTTDAITLDASAQTTISYGTSDERIAYVDTDNRLVIVRAGSVTITAYAAEDEKYETTTLSKEIEIALTAPEIISMPTIAESIAYGTTLRSDMLTGGEANVEGAWAWLVAEGTEYVPGIYAAPVVFIPTNENWYSRVESTVEVVVVPAEQTIVWNDVLDNIRVNDTIYLTASAQTSVHYSVSDENIAVIEGNKLYFHTSGDIVVSAEAESTDLYNAAFAERTLHIGRAQAEILTDPTVAADLVYGQPLREAVLEGGEATCEGHFEWQEPDFQQSVGEYWQKVIFIPDAADVFENDTCVVYVKIVPAQQTITWELDKTMLSVGETLVLDAVASSGYEVYYELSTDDFALLDGNILTAMAAGSLTITAQQDGIDEEGYQNYNAAEPVSFVITIHPAATTGIRNQQADKAGITVRKVLRNGQIYILRGEEVFTLQGYKVQ